MRRFFTLITNFLLFPIHNNSQNKLFIFDACRMNYFIRFFVLFFLVFTSPALAWNGKVVSVTDGDTIKVLHPEDGQIKIRLYGIDTPEKGQPFGQAATKHLASLIAGKTVEVESVDKDRYGRIVGIVSFDGNNANEQMVQDGFAWVYRRYCVREFCDEWLRHEAEAMNSKIGLWVEPNPVPPWEWRRRK